MLAESGNIRAWVEHRSPKSCLAGRYSKVERVRIVEGVMDCVQALEMIGGTRLGIMILYMEISGERKSLP